MSIEPIVLSLQHVRETDAAVTLIEALGRHATRYEEFDDLSKCCFKLKKYLLSIFYGEEALKLCNTLEMKYVTRSNLINVYNHANFPESAMAYILENLKINPTDSDMLLEKAFSHFLMNEKTQAEQILRQELKKKNNTLDTINKIKFNLGTYDLYRDNFLEGLGAIQKYGMILDFWKKPKLPGEYWSGQKLEGRDILVYAEAGIGDEVISVRFMKHLKERGANPIWYTTRKDIAAIFTNSGFKVITDMKDRPLNSLWTHSMPVPVYLKLNYADLWSGPYINSSMYRERAQEATPRLKHNKLKIGLRWQGNPEYDHDLHRSVLLRDIISTIPQDADWSSFELYSLQRDTGLNELTEFQGGVIDMSSKMQSFEDTLGIIDNLDIVITTCTSVAHMAASSGKRTFVFVPISAYYTWSHSMEQSPWYGDNVTILRQQRPRDWEEPMLELKEHLNRLFKEQQ